MEFLKWFHEMRVEKNLVPLSVTVVGTGEAGTVQLLKSPIFAKLTLKCSMKEVKVADGRHRCSCLVLG